MSHVEYPKGHDRVWLTVNGYLIAVKTKGHDILPMYHTVDREWRLLTEEEKRNVGRRTYTTEKGE